MKTMKKLFLLVAISLATGVQMSCTDYQDEIDALDVRVTDLENLVKKINTDLKSLHKLLDAMADGDAITNVTDTEDGCIVTFKDAGAVVIHDGRNGTDGQDAVAPTISLAQDPDDGKYYWVLDGQPILDENGNKVCASGKDGEKGADGKAPRVRINPDTGEWELSLDDGASWIGTGTNAEAKDGKDGEKGADGSCVFESVQAFQDADGVKYVVFTMKDTGLVIKVPMYVPGS